MMDYKLVLFDVDGVLVDSLQAHHQFFLDRNKQHGLNLSLPDLNGFKSIIESRSTSPFIEFMMEFGFKKKDAELAFESYNKNFGEFYSSDLFFGVESMIQDLDARGVTMGLVTANNFDNVFKPLESIFGRFHYDCFYYREKTLDRGKVWAIHKCIKSLGIKSQDVLFVGDQLSDWKYSKEVPVDFLGVTYGWAFNKKNDYEFPTVDSVPELYKYILVNA